MAILRAVAALPPLWSTARLGELAQELEPLTTLEAVVRWGFERRPPRDVADIVIQDEDTHDVVVPLEGALHLVFDTT